MNPDRAVLIVTVICALLAGCATFEPHPPSVSQVVINGEVWTEYTDARDAPTNADGVGTLYRGCTSMAKRRIDYQSPVLASTVRHERAHAAGMTHGPYSMGFANSICATVWQPGGEYRTGDTICSTLSGEAIIPSTLFAEAK